MRVKLENIDWDEPFPWYQANYKSDEGIDKIVRETNETAVSSAL